MEIQDIAQQTLARIGEQREKSTSVSTRCPECGGLGFITKYVIDDYYREVYGREQSCLTDKNGNALPVEYIEDCPKCKGNKPDKVIDLTGVPSLYRDADLSKFKWSLYEEVDKAREIHKVVSSFFSNYEEWKKENKGLYLWSKKSGTGKTFLACCLAKSVMTRYDIQMRFISVPDYFNLLKERMDQSRGEYDRTKVYQTCDLLILDDIGTTPNKEWYEMELFRLLDARMVKGLVTIVTSNSQLEDLKHNDRLVDRIGKGCFPIHFPEQSVRKQQSDASNKAFMERMGL